MGVDGHVDKDHKKVPPKRQTLQKAINILAMQPNLVTGKERRRRKRNDKQTEINKQIQDIFMNWRSQKGKEIWYLWTQESIIYKAEEMQNFKQLQILS